jgi:hypothetical protein
MLMEPCIDGGIVFDSAVQSEQLCIHRRHLFAFGFMLRDPRFKNDDPRFRIALTAVSHMY